MKMDEQVVEGEHSGVDEQALQKARYVEGYHRASPGDDGEVDGEDVEDNDPLTPGAVSESDGGFRFLSEGEHLMQ
jgi:hypothetical protein